MSKRKFSASALKKGFVENRRRDHVYFYLTSNDGDEIGIHTKISHGGGDDISASLITKMYKQLGFKTKAEFESFVECTLSEEEYRSLLKNR